MEQFSNEPLTAQELQEYYELKRQLKDKEKKEEFELEKSKAGSPVETFARALSRGITLDYPVIEKLIRDKSWEELNKEIIAQREENPKAAFAGEFLGSMLTPMPGSAIGAATKGAVKLGGKELAKQIAKGAGIGAAQGGALGFLSNPVVPEREAFTDRLERGAWGALGGGVGGGAVSGVLGKFEQKAAAKEAQLAQQKELEEFMQYQIGKATESPTVPAQAQKLPEQILETPKQQVNPAQSLDEIQRINRESQLKFVPTGELPRQEELVGAVARLGDKLEVKPLPIHYEIQGVPEVSNRIKRMIESPGKVSEVVSEHSTLMKRNLEKLLNDEANVIGSKASDATTEAKRVIGEFQKEYNDAQAKMSPSFKLMSKMKSRNPEILDDVIFSLNNEIKEKTGSELARRITTRAGTQRLALKPFNTVSGISKDEYKILSRVVEDINRLNLGTTQGNLIEMRQIQNMREYIRKSMDPKRPGDYSFLPKLRKRMLTSMEEIGKEHGDDIYSVMQQWAKNETRRDLIEDIIGVIERVPGSKERQIAFENVASNILRDSTLTQQAVDSLGKERVRSIVGSFIKENAALNQNQTGFSGARLKRFLDQNQESLSIVLSPDELQRIRDISTVARLVPDQAKANPSGTAGSLLDIARRSMEKGPISGTMEGVREVLRNKAAQKEFEDLLGELGAKWQPRISETEKRLSRRKKVISEE